MKRRDLFGIFVRPLKPAAQELRAAARPAPPALPPENRVAIVQGRHCLALVTGCSLCVERCPVPGALEQGKGPPMVVREVCTGCGICHDICPAPENAILMLPRRPIPGRPE